MRRSILLLFMVLSGFTADNLKPLVLSSTNQPKNMTTGDSMWIAPYYGLDSAKPAAAAAPHCLYFATDNSRLYRSNGTTWTVVAGGTIGVSQGGTGFSAYVVGDILYADSTSSLATRAIGANNTVLRSDGTAPSWSNSLALTGAISASNLSGTNTGDQTITLTGNVTGSGTGSFATTVANDAITNAKLANVATQTFKGRTTAATGDPEDLTVAQAKTMLNLTGTNSGDVTLAAIGSTPNANGATLSTQTLNLEPASASFGGVVTTGAQTFAGAKTFSSIVTGPAATTSAASFNLPHGAAPTAPVNGDLWTTASGFFGRVNGATVGPFGAGGGGITGTLTSGRVPFANGSSSVTDSPKMVFDSSTGFNVNMGGTNNLSLGTGAGDSLTLGSLNVILGKDAATTATNASFSVIIGAGAASATSGIVSGVAIGNSVVGSNTGSMDSDSVFIGTSTGGASTDTGSATIAIGGGALFNSTGNNNVAVGANSGSIITTGANNSFFGNDSSAGSNNISNSIAIGNASRVRNSNEMVVGSSTSAINSIVLGNGDLNGTPQASTRISTTSGVGSNVAGSVLQLAGGKSTGTGNGGSVVLQTSPSGSSGSALNSLVDRLTVNSAGNVEVNTLGAGLRIKEGSNAKMGTSVLVAGAATVSNTNVTLNSRILLTSQVDGGTVGFLRVSARTAGTSFTITSSSGSDTSTIAWFIVEPSP